MGLILTLLGCTANVEDPAPASSVPTLDDAALLTRASLDLRGRRPSIVELDALAADPGARDGMIDAMFDLPEFETRVASIYADIYLTRQDEWVLSASAVGLDDEATYVQSVGDEVPRFIGRVAATDRPWTDLVTADWTMADETLRTIWPLTGDGSGWQESRYTDGRPALGVLGTNSFWWRYPSSESNLGRGRANAISKLLLCNDYLARDIEFDRSVDLSDEAAVREALETNPSCVSCHVSLDPLAANLFVFYTLYEYSPVEQATWHPDRETMWEDTLGVAPAYFGQPTANIWEMSRAIAADRRFVTCAVEQASSALLQRPSTIADAEALTAHREAFLAGGLTLRALYRSVLESDAYRASGERGVRKLVTPDLLASQVEALTGYRLTSDGWDLLRNGTLGLRLLAGGADGVYVTSNVNTPNVTTLLVQERLAEAAATYVAAVDHAAPTHLFTSIDFTETPATARDAMVNQLQELHRAVLSTPADDAEVDALLALWSDLYADGADAEAAWAGVLTALLRDPTFVVY